MQRVVPGIVILFLLFSSATAVAQSDATPPPVAGIERFLLTEDQVPEGLVLIQDGDRTLQDVASGFEDPAATMDQFEEWEWQRNAVRAFHTPEGAEVAPGEIDGIYMSVHEFGSPEAAAEALDYSAEVHASGGDLEELQGVDLGDDSRALYGEMSYGDEVTLYVQQGSVLIRLSAASPEGDPTNEATELMQLVLESVPTTPVATP